MRSPRTLSAAVSVAAALLLPALAAPAAQNAGTAPAEPAGKTLVIGRVTDKPQKHYKYMKPLVDYVAARLGDLGYTGGEVVLAEDNRQMISLLRRGKVDWVSETAFSAQAYHEKAGAEFLVRRWKKGVPEYHTVIFVRKDSDIESLADLRGRTIAFEDEGSTSGFFVPAAELLEEGHELIQLQSPREEAPAEMVGYAFARQEVNTTNWVHKRLVDAGAFSNLDWETRDHMGLQVREEMRIIHRTRSLPRAVELVRSDLDDAVKRRIREILIAAEHDPQGQAALASYQRTRRFDPLTDDMLVALDETGQMRQLVTSRLF